MDCYGSETADITSGNRIFVNLYGKTTINLQQGDFQVIDGNGTDGTGTCCSVYNRVLVRNKGGSSWTNVSQDLLYVYADTNGDGKLERYSLFSDPLASYFWDYDNTGLKLAQLRFYEQISTTVASP